MTNLSDKAKIAFIKDMIERALEAWDKIEDEAERRMFDELSTKEWGQEKETKKEG